MNKHYPPNSKPVIGYNFRGEVVYEFYSCSRAAYSVGRDKRTISAVCKGNRKTSAGVAWFFRSEVDKMTKEELLAAIKERFVDSRSTNGGYRKTIPVSCLIDGKRVEFESITACGKALNRNPVWVNKIVRGVIKKNLFDIQKV